MQGVGTSPTGHVEFVFVPVLIIGGIAFVLLALTLYIFRRRRKRDEP